MRRDTDGRDTDAGYALVAAVAAVAVFAYLAFQVLAAHQGAIAAVRAPIERAKLAAAADAGIALAIHGLAAEGPGGDWSDDGRVRTLQFDDIVLEVTVEDERGKAPLSSMTDGQARALFSGAGAAGDRLDALVAEFRDWVTDPATGAAPVVDHLPPSDGRPVRRGPMLTVGELAQLPDMTAAIYARVAPVVTVFDDGGGFDAEHASPLAKAAEDGDTLETPDQIGNQPAAANQHADGQIADARALVGVPLTIRVVARDRSGGQGRRMEVIELTGDRARPYWVRYAE
jgi:general secretion pathway protein K